jgi:hypothetical protein
MNIDGIDYDIQFIYNDDREGLQNYSRDKYGFCVSFSLFWLNLILLIIQYNIKNNSYSTTDKWINNVEKYVLSILNRQDTFKIILLFVSDIFNEFMANRKQNFKSMSTYESYINRALGKEIKTRIEINFSEYNKLLNAIESRVKPKKSYKSNYEMLKESKNKPDILYETWEEEVLKELKDYNIWKEEKEILQNKKLKHLWKSIVEKRKAILNNINEKLLGRKCNKSNECFSGLCKQHICYPKRR